MMSKQEGVPARVLAGGASCAVTIADELSEGRSPEEIEALCVRAEAFADRSKLMAYPK